MTDGRMNLELLIVIPSSPEILGFHTTKRQTEHLYTNPSINIQSFYLLNVKESGNSRVHFLCRKLKIGMWYWRRAGWNFLELQARTRRGSKRAVVAMRRILSQKGTGMWFHS